LKLFEGVYTVGNEMGIRIEPLDLLVVSDLHIGYEEALQGGGIYIPLSSYPRIQEALVRMKELSGAENLLINGDLKHEFGGATTQEWSEVLSLLSTLKEHFQEVKVVRGNHDNYLIPILKRRGIELHDPLYVEEGYAFTHGHKPLLEMGGLGVEYLILGHEHPAIAIREEFGVKRKFKAILKGEVGGLRVLVLPVLSPLMMGNEIDWRNREGILSPILRGLDIGGFAPIVVDQEAGVYEFPMFRDFQGVEESEDRGENLLL
jgi:putative SbcD/Mre11-related phosphoesterase